MKEMIIGADLLPEAYTEKAVKSKDKCNESQPLAQEKYADFIDYLTETIGASLSGQGEGHQSVNVATEANLREFFSRYISGKDGDNINRYAYADSECSLYLYNGKHYERLDVKSLPSTSARPWSRWISA